MLFVVSYSYKIPQKVGDLIIEVIRKDKPTAPVIAGGSNNWVKKSTIEVIKDAKVYGDSKLSHYEYCITTTKNTSKCEYHRTDTKNVVLSKTGTYDMNPVSWT